MANIIINAAALICQAPVFTHTEWTGSRYIFSVDWTSNGVYYSTIDPTTNLELSIVIVQTATGTIDYTGIIQASVSFSATGYTFNIWDFFPNFSDKYTITLSLKLTSQAACNETGSITLPVDYS